MRQRPRVTYTHISGCRDLRWDASDVAYGGIEQTTSNPVEDPGIDHQGEPKDYGDIENADDIGSLR